MPGPFQAGRAAEIAGDAAAIEAGCERCHAEIAAEHRASLHRLSQIDPVYQRAFAIEPDPFCQRCHAPEASPDAPVAKALAEIGTGCVTCHVRGGVVLAAPREGPLRPAPHAVVRDARFGGVDACAGCHEFPFPPRRGRDPGERMQLTVTEHARSPYATFACADCHMPRVEGSRGKHRSHAFIASRDPAMIRAAADARAERTGPTSIRVTIAAGEVGHAFPTGDLFRRITVSAEAIGADFALLGRAERRLARRFGEQHAGPLVLRAQRSDDRVGVSGMERKVDLDLGPEAADAPIRFRVRYERVEHPISRDGEEALIEGAITIAEGDVP